jgi:hypothetical protein
MTDSDSTVKSSWSEWLIEEIVNFSVLSAYLFVCFASLLYLKFSILEAQGVSFAPWGFAAIKAVIVAKFMIVLRRFDRHRTDEKRPLIVPTLYKSLALLVLLVVLMTIEELIAGFIHGRSTTQTIHEMGGGTVHQKIATTFVMLLILVPFFAFRALGDVVGNRNLVRLFFQGRHRTEGE